MRLLSLCLLTVPSFFVQQQDNPNQTQRQRAESPNMSTTRATKGDGLLAGWLAVDSHNEIVLAQIAQQKAQDSEVKQFAQKMIDDHRQMAQKLQPFATAAGFAPALASSGSTQTDRDRDRDTRNPDDLRDRDRERDMDSRPREAGFSNEQLDHVALIQELGKQCLDSARRELEQKSGAEFDKCYMGMMVGEHMKANDMLTVFQRHASSDLKNVLAEGQSTVIAHLRHAKSLVKKLDTGADTGRMGEERR